MLSLSEIQTYYPAHLQHRGEFLLREYVQYKILELLFESNYALKFSFLGGTCLRIIHNNNRFSEDLDFDNFNLTTDFNRRRRSSYSGPTGRWHTSLPGCYRYGDPNGPLYRAVQSKGKALVLRIQIEKVHFLLRERAVSKDCPYASRRRA